MAQQRRSYKTEFKRRGMELVRAGRSPEELAREFEPSPNTIRKWATQADLDEIRGDCAPKFDPVKWSVCATPAGVEALRFEISERGLVAHA